ncbi:MAG: ferritin-like domain-containing protein [Actinomycetota bacterium]|nr:ferritin-like domain-containing protein [Actinomycetota bacterium]
MAGLPSTRRELLASGAAGVALASPAAALAASKVAARPDPPDARLRRLLTVELLLGYCYQYVFSSSLLSPGALPIVELQAGHEQAHVHALRVELTRLSPSGAIPVAPTGIAAADRDLARRKVTGRLGQLQGERDALYLLLEVERVVTGAYFVALTKLEDPRLIALAISIMSVEAQHAALIGDLLNPEDAQQSVPYGLIQGTQ